MPGWPDQFKIAVIVQKMPPDLCFAVDKLPIYMRRRMLSGAMQRRCDCIFIGLPCDNFGSRRGRLAAAVPATRSSGHAANALRLGVVVHNAWVASKTAVTDGCISGLMIWSGSSLAYRVVWQQITQQSLPPTAMKYQSSYRKIYLAQAKIKCRQGWGRWHCQARAAW